MTLVIVCFLDTLIEILTRAFRSRYIGTRGKREHYAAYKKNDVAGKGRLCIW